jgi:hypothetical protein
VELLRHFLQIHIVYQFLVAVALRLAIVYLMLVQDVAAAELELCRATGVTVPVLMHNIRSCLAAQIMAPVEFALAFLATASL